jgi:hypothetical protein
MADENRSQELPQRTLAAGRAGPTPPAPPILTEELRQRIQAAVKAEREHKGENDALTEPVLRDAEPTPPSREGSQPIKPEPSGNPGHTVKPSKQVTPEPDASPQPTGGVPANDKRVAVLRAPPNGSMRPRAGRRGKPDRRRRVTLFGVVVALVTIAAASLGIAVTRYFTSPRASNPPPNPAAQRQEIAARDQAATWVTQQVSHNAVVSCDQTTCAALRADGFPSRNLRVLGPTAAYPLTSAVVVVTAYVRNLFGSSLSSDWAPGVLAAFGSGYASITVRVIAPDGAAVYRQALAADGAARKTTGADLADVNGIMLSPAAKTQLVAGQPDSRLLLAIAALAADKPIDIVQFGNVGPGGDADMPLRFADLAENVQAAHMTGSAYVQSVKAYLSTVPARFRPASTETVVLPSGQAVLRIAFTAPSPLGLLGPQGGTN